MGCSIIFCGRLFAKKILMASLGLKIVMPKIVIFPPSDYRFAAVFSRHTVTGETETRDKNTSGRTILLTCAGRRSQSPTVTLAVRASQWTSRLSRLATTGWLAGSTPSVCRLPPSRRHRRRVFLPPLQFKFPVIWTGSPRSLPGPGAGTQIKEKEVGC